MNTSTHSRRRLLGIFALAAPAALVSSALAQGPSSAARRVADRARRDIGRRRHRIVSFTAANARQRQVAMENARRYQEKLRNEWARKNGGSAASVSMSKVVQDLGRPAIQAVKTTPSPGATSSVVAVNVATGTLVSGKVVNSSSPITQGTNISQQVREAAKDPAVPGSAPAEFVSRNISLAAI